MPPIGSDLWLAAFNAAVADIDAGATEVAVLHRIDGGPSWLVTAAGGAVRVDAAAPDAAADVSFTWQRADAEAVARGECGPLVPFQAGRLKVGGDLGRLTAAAELFARFPPVPIT